MKRNFLLVVCLALLGCGGARQALLPAGAEQTAEARKLHEILDRDFEEYLELFPVFATEIGDHRYDDRYSVAISEEHRARQRAVAVKYLGELAAVDKNRLSREDTLNYDLFRYVLNEELGKLKRNRHLIPVTQLSGAPIDFPLLGSGRGLHPFKTPRDYDNFLKRVDGFESWIDTAIANMRRGAEQGLVQPRVVMDRTLPQIEAMIVADAKRSMFYQPIAQMPDDFSAADKARLARAYSQAIDTRIVPAYKKLHAFIRQEYLPKTRATVGMSDLPGGSDWYAELVKIRTTTDLSPDAIFEMGKREVARIRSEMEKMRAASGFAGNFAEYAEYLYKNAAPRYASKAQLVGGYESLRGKVAPLLPKLFGRLPKAPFEIRPVEEFRENSAPSQYWSASPDGSRPGIFYVNASWMGDGAAGPISEWLFLHEAIPGHHFQIALQQEQENLPRFRRFGGYTAFVEGWGLYAESLGRELGLYAEPHQYFSRLNSELFRAVRLVVDVGLHQKHWPRAEALKYMMDNMSIGEAGALLEIDRYIANPAQALAYKVGQLKIAAIRSKAEKALRAKFDIRAFHDELLKDGALPLDFLEGKMDAWIESQLR